MAVADTKGEVTPSAVSHSAGASVTESASSSSVGSYMDLDLSYLGLEDIPEQYKGSSSEYSCQWVKSLVLHHNAFSALSDTISNFKNLVALDFSNNVISDIPVGITKLQSLRILIAKSNQLNSLTFPKHFSALKNLEVLNLSGNLLEELPPQILELPKLKALYVGGNNLQAIPCAIGDLTSLEVLYLGGNELREVPATIGKLHRLSCLVLCENKLETIPSTVAQLQKLRSLSLHKNLLRTLPPEIVTLQNLQELSLRGNPLVVNFARDISFEAPTLKELAGRSVKLNSVPYGPYDIPATLITYLETAHQCVNPKCKGVYFEACVEHVKFVDFCGKYRVPLMQYLCSPICSTSPAYTLTTSDSSDGEMDEEDLNENIKLRKVLLG